MAMLWVKTFHIVFIASWFAGLFYLPRIFVNLAQQTDASVQATLLGMARRLYRFTTILAVVAIVFGGELGRGAVILERVVEASRRRGRGNVLVVAQARCALLRTRGARAGAGVCARVAARVVGTAAGGGGAA